MSYTSSTPINIKASKPRKRLSRKDQDENRNDNGQVDCPKHNTTWNRRNDETGDWECRLCVVFKPAPEVDSVFGPADEDEPDTTTVQDQQELVRDNVHVMELPLHLALPRVWRNHCEPNVVQSHWSRDSSLSRSQLSSCSMISHDGSRYEAQSDMDQDNGEMSAKTDFGHPRDGGAANYTRNENTKDCSEKYTY